MSQAWPDNYIGLVQLMRGHGTLNHHHRLEHHSNSRSRRTKKPCSFEVDVDSYHNLSPERPHLCSRYICNEASVHQMPSLFVHYGDIQPRQGTACAYGKWKVPCTRHNNRIARMKVCRHRGKRDFHVFEFRYREPRPKHLFKSKI